MTFATVGCGVALAPALAAALALGVAEGTPPQAAMSAIARTSPVALVKCIWMPRLYSPARWEWSNH